MIHGDASIDAVLRERLVCPRDCRDLTRDGAALICESGHRYPLTPDEIPLLLLDDVAPTHGVARESLARASLAPDATRGDAAIDPYVAEVIAATGGALYRPLIGALRAYPIPQLRFQPAKRDASPLLDLGCNWGRWSIAAARLGYLAIGIDPNLDAVRAARRVAAELHAGAHYLVADARHLPFRADAFDVVFSYSVIQHFSKTDAKRVFAEIGRVLTPHGSALLQMANGLGAVSLAHQLRRGLREAREFEVRYWSARELGAACARLIGPTTIAADGFFSLNPQTADLELLAPRYRALVRVSEALRNLSERVPALRVVADSLMVTARKPGA